MHHDIVQTRSYGYKLIIFSIEHFTVFAYWTNFDADTTGELYCFLSFLLRLAHLILFMGGGVLFSGGYFDSMAFTGH